MSVTSLNPPIPDSPAPSIPLVLASLSTPELADDYCPRRARMQIDLLLLAIEALVIGGSEAFLQVADELELRDIIKNRVTLWQLRSTNPMRRLGQRRSMTLLEAKALVAIVCNLAKRLVVTIRQLLIDYQQLQDKQIPLEHHLRLSDYISRFRSYFRARMNPRRTGAYASDEELQQLALTMLGKLLFCTGTFGMQRLWISLFDGEVE
ncbi:MAG: DUF3038 domain-containing protein [Cyanobacteria bacterium]|nr:DUF3038 domain-containing protein [Cyanobacteriota bacterium]MDW8201581.1 DUF3038 domain-containing protein [Cyanobacteriota bacterium SKYGB_h_bin112]